MNTNPWLQERLNDEHQRQLREFADRERAAQAIRNEAVARPRRSLLSKLRAEMSNLTERREQPETVVKPSLQHQS